MTDEKDQVSEEKQSEEKAEEKEVKVEETKVEKKEEEKEPQTGQEIMDLGFEKYGDEIAGEEEEVAPVKKVEKKEEEEECIGCGKDIKDLPTEIDQINWDKVDYASPDYPKPLKEDGKAVWVKDADEMAERAMKGDDYTRKTQGISDREKAFEVERDKTIGTLESLAEKQRADTESLNALAKILHGNKDVQAAIRESEKEAGTRELTEEEILHTYGIEPDDMTDDITKKVALENYALKLGLKKSDDRFTEEKQKTDFIILEKFAGGIVKVAAEARKQYPYEEVMGEDGKGNPVNKTAIYFTEQMVSRIEAQKGKPANERREAGDIATDLVKEIHEMQKGTTSSKEGTVNLADLTLDQINAKIKEARPDLFSDSTGGNDKGKKPEEKDQSSTDEPQKKERSAPSLRTENREKVDIQHFIKSKGEGQPRFMTPEEGLKAAFDDGEIDFDAED